MITRVLMVTGLVPLFSLTAVAQTTQPGAPNQSAPQITQPAPAPTAPAGGAQSGIRTVDPASMTVTFYTVKPADILAENLIDADVYNLQNEEVGEIEDLIIDEGKTIRAVVIGVGGFLGIGERRVAVDPGSLVINRGANGEIERVVINTTRDNLKNAPEFKFEGSMRRKN